jgi:EpsI family protein
VAVIKSSDSVLYSDLSILEKSFSKGSSDIKPISVHTWSPIFNNANVQFQGKTYVDLKEVQLHFLGYTGATEAELISWNNRVFEPDQWTIESNRSRLISVDELELKVSVLKIVSNAGRKRTIIYWYQTPGILSSNKFEVKIRQALNVLIGKAKGGAFIALTG